MIVRPALLSFALLLGLSSPLPAQDSATHEPSTPSSSMDTEAVDLDMKRDWAADCSQTFVPRLEPTDDPRYRDPTETYVSERPSEAGVSSSYAYRQVDHSYVYSVEDEAYPWLASLSDPDVRLEGYDGSDYSIRVASREDESGDCTRIIIRMEPPVVQVGIIETTVATNPEFRNLAPDMYPEGYDSELTFPEIEPGETTAHIVLYRDGEPQHNSTLYARMDARGIPGEYGGTVAHEHIGKAFAGTLYGGRNPSMRLQDDNYRGQEISLETDNEARATLPIQAGYRGGPETLVVRSPDGALEAAATVLARHREFVHFAEVAGHDETPTPERSFPFVLTGWTEDHHYNHYVDQTMAPEILRTFRSIWEAERSRLEEESDDEHFIQLNDMSLEYGGMFNLRQDASHALECTEEERDGARQISHVTHNVGLDFDVAPCYSEGEDGLTLVTGAQCESGDHQRINEAVLTAHVVMNMGGTVYMHAPSIDGTPFHYHVRIPPSAPPIVDCEADEGVVSPGHTGSVECTILNAGHEEATYSLYHEASGVVTDSNLSQSSITLQGAEQSETILIHYGVGSDAEPGRMVSLRLDASTDAGDDRGSERVRIQVGDS